MTGAKKAA
uniref:Uncharacterized protein n=1 Tax=Arundo donax TaxID=35708 RepID=A0A0A9B5D6_ARUDO